MRAAVFEGNGRLVLTERPEPKIAKATDVLLRVRGVGICGTDLHILQVPPAHPARLGIVQGHEFTGEVAEVGSGVSEFSPGDQVLVDPHPGCGQCSYCRNGFPDQCSTLIASSGEPGHPGTIGIFSDGGFASHVLVPFYGLYKLRKRVPFHLAALAEPLACVLHSVGKLGVSPGDAVVVLGATAGPGLIARALAELPLVLCAAPAYVARRGRPEAPDDLARHDCLNGTVPDPALWRFTGAMGEVSVAVGGRLASRSAILLRDAAIAGAGVLLAPARLVREDLVAGRLERLLEAHTPLPAVLAAVYPADRHLSVRLQAILTAVATALAPES